MEISAADNKQGSRSRIRRIATLFLIPIVITLVFIYAHSVNAVSPSIMINEIMYNPASGVDDDEFLELHNTTGGGIDLNGWCFTAGITLCFNSSTILTAGDYAVVSRNPSQTLSTYGKTAIGTYTGKLDNSGETVTLVDASAAIVNSVTYDDSGDWPLSPDGSGPSLELKDPSFDNTLASSWGASNGPATPAAVNSLFGVTPPTVSNVVKPSHVQPGNTETVTANVQNATNVDLVYKVMFATDQTITMYDDGAHGDGGAGDDVYGAELPALAAGELMRYKINATNLDGITPAPSTDDSQNYYGYVAEEAVVTNAPIIRWFMSDADYQDMLTNHVEDNVYLDSVVAYDGVVYDNAKVRIRGGASRFPDKKSFKFKLPKGYGIDMPGGDALALNEFNIGANMQSQTAGILPAVWWMAEQSGTPVPADMTPVRVQKNGEFQGLYIYFDKYEKEWRDLHGFNSGELYEDGSMVVSGASDTTTIDAFKANIAARDVFDSSTLDYVLDTYDIPATLNYMSTHALIGSYDTRANVNSLQYYDKTRTQRWQPLIWDLDLNLDTSKVNYLSPFNYASGYGDDIEENFSYGPVYTQQVLRELYFRRIRTILDKTYSGNEFLIKFQTVSDLYDADQQLDLAKWPRQSAPPRADMETSIARIKLNMLNYMRRTWAIPAAQTDSERQQVSISEAVYDADSANEYIKISNNSAAHVDISGWQISGISYTISPGSVVPAGGSLYLLKNDVGYRNTHSSVLVGGQYATGLSALGGQLVLTTETGMVIDSYDY